MNIDQMIEALNALKEKHGGEVNATVWLYGGGLDDLCEVVPVFDEELGMVVFETTVHDSGIRR